jgi:hypothetical protein
MLFPLFGFIVKEFRVIPSVWRSEASYMPIASLVLVVFLFMRLLLPPVGRPRFMTGELEFKLEWELLEDGMLMLLC